VRPCSALPLLDAPSMAVCLAQDANAFPPPVAAPWPLFESKMEL
jgi:hypothetical protein